MSTDVEAHGLPEGVDVSTSARLAAALEEVRREPGGWESALGLAVDAAVVAAVPERVGAGRISYLVERGFWSGRAEVVSELVGVVRELVMMRPVLLEVGPARLWPAVGRCGSCLSRWREIVSMAWLVTRSRFGCETGQTGLESASSRWTRRTWFLVRLPARLRALTLTVRDGVSRSRT